MDNYVYNYNRKNEKVEFNKGINLHNKINDHIIKLVRKTKGLQGIPIATVRQHIANHLDEFDDLEYAKMMFKEIRESPYYSQLTQCVNLLSLFLED